MLKRDVNDSVMVDVNPSGMKYVNDYAMVGVNHSLQ